MATRFQRGWTVPGFGLPLIWPEMVDRRWQPLNWANNNTLLPSALDASEDPQYCYTTREIAMIAMINELTDLPQWDRKICDPDFTFTWKSAKVVVGQDVTRSMVDWCVEEVKYYLHDFLLHHYIPAIDGGVIKSDDCVGRVLQNDLQNAAAAIRSQRAHSEEDSQLTYLVDPNLFPFVFERSRVLRRGNVALNDCIPECGRGEPVKMPPEGDCMQNDPVKYPNEMAWSRRFQWLPFDLKFDSSTGGAARVSSYINNLHPTHHRALYHATQDLIETCIPLFNRMLVDLKAPGYRNQRMHLAMIDRDPVIVCEPGPFRPPERSGRHINRYLDESGRYDPAIFVDLKREFWNIGLQMVLEMRDIDLTAANPEFPGEDWHVQGQSNERICATAYYVYSTRNLSSKNPPTLSFRCRINPEEGEFADGEIHPPLFTPELYGAEDGDPLIQQLGSVALREGRLVVFPNTFQLKLDSFRSADESQPGFCRIAMLHLLDPNRRNMSTKLVPCQRRDWWAEELRQTCPRFGNLPLEIFERIIGSIGEGEFPISMVEAQKIRDEFRRERAEFRRRHTDAMLTYGEWDFRSH